MKKSNGFTSIIIPHQTKQSPSIRSGEGFREGILLDLKVYFNSYTRPTFTLGVDATHNIPL